jgi:tRNA uridine 5-carboxymethylaminomethyl modification enzyme
MLRDTSNLYLVEGECALLIQSGTTVDGLQLTDSRVFRFGAVVLTTGTFLNGVIHRGEEKLSAGRLGDKAVFSLSRQLVDFGLTMGRLKTGTPPRLDGRTIDFGSLEPQWGDADPQYLSSLTARSAAPQTLCFLTRTTPVSHAIVRRSVHRTAVYSGAVSGSGPRYCPSIEDKVVRFGDRDSHQVFLEPEGLGSDLIYPNGISTSLPANIQVELVRSIPGLERARIVQAGYAIEYDYVNPMELLPSLMTRRLSGLFLAGQINGTTGYEEAAAQGIVAGINAVLHSGGRSTQVFDRTNSYLGVMIDDLITRGVTEPYRMFTSRAEFRLSLRADNADERLTPIGLQLGAVAKERRNAFNALTTDLGYGRRLLNQLSATSSTIASAGLPTGSENVKRSAFGWAGLPDLRLIDLTRIWPEISTINARLLPRLEADAKYHIYVERQKRDMERQKADEQLKIPVDFDFNGVAGLSNELKAKFERSRPSTVGHASRLEGVTPAALLLLAAHAKRLYKANSSKMKNQQDRS